MTKGENINLFNVLSDKKLGQLSGAKFAYAVAKNLGLLQSEVDALKKAVQEVIDANPGPVTEYRGGKEANLQFLVGQSMKATKGAGNPQVLKELLVEALKG